MSGVTAGDWAVDVDIGPQNAEARRKAVNKADVLRIVSILSRTVADLGGMPLYFPLQKDDRESSYLDLVARVGQSAGVIHRLRGKFSLVSRPSKPMAAVFIQVRRE
jgi:hypothetical protein